MAHFTCLIETKMEEDFSGETAVYLYILMNTLNNAWFILSSDKMTSDQSFSMTQSHDFSDSGKLKARVYKVVKPGVGGVYEPRG